MPDLLIELFSEEIPARMQPRAREDLRRLMTDGLVEAGLTYRSAGAFSTPRRLTLAVEGLDAQSKPVRDERKGPRTDAPEAAIQGFLRATGLTLDQLERRAEKKGEAFYAVVERPGRAAAEIVAARPRTRMWRALAGTVLFVAGFGVVFVGSATLAGALGGIVLRWQGPLTRAMGAIMIALRGGSGRGVGVTQQDHFAHGNSGMTSMDRQPTRTGRAASRSPGPAQPLQQGFPALKRHNFFLNFTVN